jgi:polysaccharide biosynthesis/export protein
MQFRNRFNANVLVRLAFLCAPATCLPAQQLPAGQPQPPLQQGPVQQQGAIQQQGAMQPQPGVDTDRLRLSYQLGANDQIMLRSPEIPELNEKVFRVDVDGTITLPLVGSVPAAGLTVQQFEEAVTKNLQRFYRAPQVTVLLIQFRTDPVFFVGAFRSPGIHSLQGGRRLIEMLTYAGGLQGNASRRVVITRRLDIGKIPLSTARENPERGVSIAEISLTRLMETVNPEEDIELMPYDTIRVGTEEMVYVSGEIGRTGGIPLVDKDSISLLQVLTLSGGLTPAAMPQKSKVLRPVLDTTRRAEIEVDIKAILEGRANDFPLLPNDLLVIPRAQSSMGAVKRYAAVTVPAVAYSLIYVLIR